MLFKSISKGILLTRNVVLFKKVLRSVYVVVVWKSHCFDRTIQAADLHIHTWRYLIHCINKQILIFIGIQLRWQAEVILWYSKCLNGGWSRVMNGKWLINDERVVRTVHGRSSCEIALIGRFGRCCYQWTIRHFGMNGIGGSVRLDKSGI